MDGLYLHDPSRYFENAESLVEQLRVLRGNDRYKKVYNLLHLTVDF
jgi:hypothetical protein